MGDLTTLGEITAHRISAREAILDEIASALDRLHVTREDLLRLAPTFQTLTRRSVRAIAIMTRTHALRLHASRLAQFRAQAEAERTTTPAEAMIGEAVEAFNLEREIPTLQWAEDLLMPPRLVEG